jgi:catechol 2,3-dioxygenase-like lactoylglutathione lyase family enzyme
MLNRGQPMGSIVASDLKSARQFYEEVVGLTPLAESTPGVIAYPCGQSSLFVRQSDGMRPIAATAATWFVGDEIETVVRELSRKGIHFENYGPSGAAKDGDVHIFGKMRLAWFKDPDGNVHALANA